MPLVRLLKDVAEGGRGLDEAIKAAESFGLDKAHPMYPRLKTTSKKGVITEYKAGLEVTMGEEGAKKWVERGIAQIIDKPETAKK
jgi:hypothetical protein